MGYKTRKSSFQGAIQRVGAGAVGIGVGGILVPKIVEMIDPSGKFPPTIVNAVGAAGALYFAKNQSGGMFQDLLYGMAAGLAWGAVAPLVGMGYVDDSSTNFLHRVAGGDDYFPSRQNPGEV